MNDFARIRLPALPSARGRAATWFRALADRLVGPVERWCPICELELKLNASERAHSSHHDDD